MANREDIEKYWESPDTISLIDNNLRKLETQFVESHLKANDIFADLGCGGGESTFHYAQKVKSCHAIEQSEHLLSKAQQILAPLKDHDITTHRGDVRNLADYQNQFTKVSTQRVIINFSTWEEQQLVLDQIHQSLQPGGHYLMIENTYEGFEELNSTRTTLGLKEVPLHWHNNFLYHDKLMKYFEGKFEIVETQDFNLYYLLTRVFVNMFASFEGYGKDAVKDDIFPLADKAAFNLHQLLNDKITVDVKTGNSFGPIQGWVLKKI